jgi:hypothetical protein
MLRQRVKVVRYTQGSLCQVQLDPTVSRRVAELIERMFDDDIITATMNELLYNVNPNIQWTVTHC